MTTLPFGRIAFVLFCALVLLYLILPVLIIVPMSFSGARFLSFPPPSLSLRWYQEYLDNSGWMQATRVTATVAVLTVLIATPLGVAAAYAISHSTLRVMRMPTPSDNLPASSFSRATLRIVGMGAPCRHGAAMAVAMTRFKAARSIR